jgi:hypothetical protein
MWERRKRGQLHKVAKAASLRAAFPEETGNDYTAEEMSGKEIEAGGIVIDGHAEHAPDLEPELAPVSATETVPEEAPPPNAGTRFGITDPGKWLDALNLDLSHAQTPEEIDAILACQDVVDAQDKAKGPLRDRLQYIVARAVSRARELETSAPYDDPALMARQEAYDPSFPEGR